MTSLCLSLCLSLPTPTPSLSLSVSLSHTHTHTHTHPHLTTHFHVVWCGAVIGLNRAVEETPLALAQSPAPRPSILWFISTHNLCERAREADNTIADLTKIHLWTLLSNSEMVPWLENLVTSCWSGTVSFSRDHPRQLRGGHWPGKSEKMSRSW